MVKNLPAMQEMQVMRVRSLGWGDPLGEGNGNPLQYSCLENLMDRGAWKTAVHRVAELVRHKTEHAHKKETNPFLSNVNPNWSQI